MYSVEIHQPSLEVFKNKSHHVKFVCQRIFQHVSNTSATILCPISILMQLVFLKTQNMKVVELFLRFHRILNHHNHSSDE